MCSPFINVLLGNRPFDVGKMELLSPSYKQVIRAQRILKTCAKFLSQVGAELRNVKEGEPNG